LQTAKDFERWLAACEAHRNSMLGVFTRFGRSIGLQKMGGGAPHLRSAGCYYDPEKWKPRFGERHCLQQAGFYNGDTHEADNNRRYLSVNGVLTLNLAASPGAGKTTLLLRSLHDLKARLAVAAIEGDQQTSRDADRIAAAGAPAIQINSGKACHLDAHAVGHALEKLTLPSEGILCFENVGNLVCPADFDLGETRRVVLLSVEREATETVMEQMRRQRDGKEAQIIGEVVADHPGMVVMRTDIGGTRIVDLPLGEQLPRIC
jgi:hydrogenase accessory protein HypB